MRSLRPAIIRALRLLSPSMEELARQLQLSSSALRRYRAGSRAPTAAVARGLARVLRERAERMTAFARKLDQLANKEEVRRDD